MTFTSTDPFFSELKDWSRRKLTLLQKYLDAAAKILSDVYYIDGFAGRGTYGTLEEKLEPGSPLLAAQLAQRSLCVNIE